MKRNLLALLVVAGSTLLPAVARAQLYTVQRATAAAPTRSGWTELTFLSAPTAPAADAGAAKITLPFSFSFYGVAYSELTATADGVILFDNDANNLYPNNPVGSRGCGSAIDARCSNGSLNRIPDASVPNNLIAFWWADMTFAAASGDARWGVSGSSPNRIVSLQYTNWMSYDSSGKSPRTVQVELFETSNEIRVYYGSITNTGDPGNGASVGLESRLVGANLEGIAGLACSDRLPGTTTAPYRCRVADWPSGDYVSFMPTPLPDLRVDAVVVTAITATTVGGGPGLQATLEVTVSNHGQNAAGGVTFDAYYTTSASAPLQTRLTQAAPFVVGSTPVTRSVTAQFARPAAAQAIYFAAKVDPDNAIAEVDETNNVSAVSAGLGLGSDLVATSVSTTVTEGVFGVPAPISFVITNAGVDSTAATTADLWLSNSRTTHDPLTSAHLATIPVPPLAAVQSFSSQGTYALRSLSGALPAGTYYVRLVVDATGVVAELNGGNNIATTGPIMLGLAELGVSGLEVTSPTTPYRELTQIHFGDTLRLAFRKANAGKAVGGIDIAAMISTGVAIKPLNTVTNFALACTPISALENLSFATNAPSTPVEVTCVVPTMNNAAQPQPLPSSPDVDWIIGVYIDAFNVAPEYDDIDNELHKSIVITRPAADLVVERLDMPWTAAPGEIVPITRTFRNAGVVAATFQYQYVLTANEIASTLDPLTPILVGTTLQPTATLTLAAGEASESTDFVQVPAIAPGEYHFGAILDPDGRVVEMDEANNAFLAPGPITLVPSRIRVETRALPSGVVGAPYMYQLVASGGVGPYLWDISAGMLPPGISLGSDGIFSGTGRAPGAFAMLVHAQWNGDHAYQWLSLRVAAATGPLAVLTAALPAARAGAQYRAPLLAGGGLPPYRWRLGEGATLPTGLTLNGSGLVEGTAAEAAALTFEVRVVDAVDAQATGTVSLRVVEGAGVKIAGVRVGAGLQPDMPMGQVGIAYSARFETDEPPVGAVTWKVISGALPAGVALNGAAITGIPVEAGMFAFLLQAEDETPSRDFGSFVLVVAPRAARFDPVTLSAVRQGERFEFNLAPHADAGTVFALHSGALPDGLTLTAEGLLSGVVARDARVGSWDFMVQLTAAHGETARVPLTIRVDAIPKAPPARKEYGCSAAGVGPAGLSVLALVALPLLGRRRQFSGR